MSARGETGCCPRFNPEPWEDREVTWQDKLFLKDRVRTFLHIPLDFGQVMMRNMKRIEQAGALVAEPLMLCDEGSLWRMDVYIAVAKEVPGAEMSKISGTFLTRVFEGPFKNVGHWAREMHAHIKTKGRRLKKMYFSYTTCPACARAYGKNYVILLAQV